MRKQSSARHGELPALPVIGHIGIFWWWDGKLLAATHPVEDGDFAGGKADSKLAHVKTWPDLQKRHPGLRWLEYEDVPRGRIVYRPRAKRFEVLMDKVLFKSHIKKAIVEKFGLPKSRTSFAADQHYTTDPDELDRLFAER